MAGDVITVPHPRLPVSVHYLTRPYFDVAAFADHTAQMNRALAILFQQSPAPFHVFLRRNPYRGMSGSALTHSFVAGWNEQTAASADHMEAFIDHELVHEWVHLDGPYEEAVWFNEGLADYYGVVLPFRAGLISQQSFLGRVNLQARLGYASPYRHVPLGELAGLYWSDFRAQQEPYYRGFFYFARLEHALRAHGHRLDDLVRRLRDQSQSGHRAREGTWRSMVDAVLGGQGQQLLNEVLTGPMALPPAPVWGTSFDCQLEQAPVVDLGFDVSTFITRTVTGLRTGSPAAVAGLRDGDLLITLPTYDDLAGQAPGQTAEVTFRRGAEQAKIQLPPGSTTALVPSWHPARPATRA